LGERFVQGQRDLRDETIKNPERELTWGLRGKKKKNVQKRLGQEGGKRIWGGGMIKGSRSGVGYVGGKKGARKKEMYWVREQRTAEVCIIKHRGIRERRHQGGGRFGRDRRIGRRGSFVSLRRGPILGT